MLLHSSDLASKDGFAMSLFPWDGEAPTNIPLEFQDQIQPQLHPDAWSHLCTEPGKLGGPVRRSQKWELCTRAICPLNAKRRVAAIYL